jgi:S1-C subfamily serine protease
LSKTTAILGGSYGALVIILVFVFLFSPEKFDLLHQASQTNSNLFDQINAKSPQLSLADLFAKSDDGVVQIIVRKSNDSSTERDIGSGIVYDTTGHIITNNHVVDSALKISVVFHDGKSYGANVVGTDPYADLAVVKVDANASVLYPLPLGNSADLRIGDQVAAIGNPFGLSGSMTQGIVSQLGRLLNPPNSSFSIPNVIQTDAPINPGNSGGPLLNMQGEVIGITTAIQSGTGEFSGVGFAIPSNTMKKIVPVLIDTGHYKHPWLGISGVSIDFDLASTLQLPVSSGFMIENVVPNSPAAIAGLHGYKETKTIDGTKYEIGGDIITGVDGAPIKQIEDILNYLQDKKIVGDKITLEIIRDGKKMDVSLTLQERPSQT